MLTDIKEDLKRVSQSTSFIAFWKKLCFNPSFKYLFYFRLANYCKHRPLLIVVYIIALLVHRKLSYKLGIQMPLDTNVGSGLMFAHYSCIVINAECKIGNHVTIYNGVTIGGVRGGEKAGAPTIGDNTVVATGAKIIGNLTIGSNVFVGANAVVVKDVPDNAVVAGVPAKILNMDGIERTRYF